jgi:hypothetical protein
MSVCAKIAARAVTFRLVFAAILGTYSAWATIINISALQSDENQGIGGNTGALINPVPYMFAAAVNGLSGTN